MIRAFTPADLPQVMELWLQGNLDAHSFISPDYWYGKRSLAAELIPQAEVYVSEQDGSLDGFLGLADGQVPGLFVRSDSRSQGIGTALLQTVMSLGQPLHLCVYEKNASALRFYRRAGFRPHQRRTDPETGEPELILIWAP